MRWTWVPAVMLLAVACRAAPAASDLAVPTTPVAAALTSTTVEAVPAPVSAALDLPLADLSLEPDPYVYIPPRLVTVQAWTPFAAVGPVTLTHPSWRVETIGFHESAHDGAQQMEPLGRAALHLTLETRQRGTESRTAADIVVDPDEEIRSPVTGRVLRAGTYVLYCEYSDDFAVIEPDSQPGWEVKILHIDHVLVTAGDRVEAGRTVIARGATPLPFRSQVDDETSMPSWPHVHIEVVDPSIPDRPSGSGC